MQNLKKVYMILTNGFDPDVRVYKEAKYLVEKGFEVTILSWDRKCEYRNEEVLDGIKIKRFSIPSVPGSGLKQIIPYIKFIYKIRKFLKNENYGYLHCHDFDGILVYLLTKKNKNRKIIFDMHEIYNNYSYAKNIFFKRIFNYILNKVNNIIFVNNDQIKKFTKEQIDKSIFLPNYPQISSYLPIEKEKYNKTRINYIGSLRDEKSLIALCEVGLVNKNIEVGLYGTGISYQKLLDKYKEKNVNIYGKYDGTKESGKIYRKTDILYCSYNPEIENWRTSYPVKFFEGIVTLTPIIVSKDTVVSDFVEKNHIGEVIEYGNEKTIENAINKIIENYDDYIKNLEKITRDYQWESIVTNLDKIYINV